MNKVSKQGKVKNRAPAPIQISSEQLLREARSKDRARTFCATPADHG